MKSRYIIIYIICCLAMMTLMSCERDHLYYQTVSRDKVQLLWAVTDLLAVVRLLMKRLLWK